jgi:hypothetical protein
MITQEVEEINPKTLWETFPVTQYELSKVFFVDERTIRRWFAGKTRPPKLVVLRAITLYEEWSKNGVNIPVDVLTEG